MGTNLLKFLLLYLIGYKINVIRLNYTLSGVFYFPIQIVKLKCKALLIKGFKGCVFIWATTGQQNPLKQVQVQHKEKKIFSLV